MKFTSNVKKVFNKRLLVLSLTIACSASAIAQQIDATTPWIWKGGDTTANQLGVYGTKGVPSVNNKPGARSQAASWTDNYGYFWLFGGRKFGSGITEAVFNDLWRYSPVTHEWTWISGDSAVNGIAVPGTQGVPATANTPSARSLTTHWKDNSGNLWVLAGSTMAGVRLNDLWKFDPVAHTWTWLKGNPTTTGSIGIYGTLGVSDIANQPGARSAAAGWTDKDGNLWLFGGQGKASTLADVTGLSDLWKYNISTNAWTWMGGSNLAPTTNHIASYGALGVVAATNKPGGRAWPVTWVDTSGSLWMMGGLGYGATTTQGVLNDLWKYNPVANTWTWMKGANVINNQGTYISQGVSAADRSPRCRFASTSWEDTDGNLWLFGGINIAWQSAYVNDIWKYNISSNEWTWIKGDSVSNVQPVYNTLNIPNQANEIGSRGVETSWREKNNNNVWVFGGQNYNGSALMSRNDMWKIEACSPVGALSSIIGPDTVCAGDTISYSVPIVPNAYSYLWEVPTGWVINNAGQVASFVSAGTGGTISVKVMGSCGDTTAIQTKTVAIQVLNPVISQTGQGLLSVSGTYASYQWYLNGTLIPGATTATYQATANGVYTVAVHSALGCTATSGAETVSGITGIENIAAMYGITLFPNPAISQLYVQSAGAAFHRITDIQGKVLLSGNTKKGTNMLDISALAQGIYFIAFTTIEGQHIYTAKIIKNNH